MADPEGRGRKRPNFIEVSQFLKSNWISLAYGLTSNKDQTLENKSCFFRYIEEYVDFVSFSGTSGGGGDSRV